MQNKTRQLTLISLFLALCIVVPIFFHSIGAGAIFLPMFLPIILAGFLIDFPYPMIVGLMGPWLSALITGMPPLFPTAFIMSAEGVVTAGLISYLYHKKHLSFWLCLIIGILGERLTLILMGFIIAPLFHLPWKLFSLYKVMESFPGILLQLILVPVLLKIIWNFKITPQK